MDAPESDGSNQVFESFPNYHNFPSHWDLSEMESPTAHSSNRAGDEAAKSRADSAAPDMPGDHIPLFMHDHFPKVRNFPLNWNLSK